MDNALKEQYNHLVEKVREANTAYYDNDDPIMADPEYDSLMSQIKDLEKQYPALITPDSPTQKVGGTASKSTFEKVEHAVPMLSLLDVFSESEVKEFLKQSPDAMYSVEEKIDGLSMSVTYEKGKLIRAETRGDGYIGENITENAKHIIGIPQTLKHISDDENLALIEVRCEVFLSVDEFIRLNNEKEDRGEKLFANPRNAAAGILRTKDLDIVKNANLSAFAFQVQRYETLDGKRDMRFESQGASLDYLQLIGFNPVTHYTVGPSGVMSFIEMIGQKRNDLPYWIDGCVVKINDFVTRRDIGETAKYPKWAIAFKYPPEEKETYITDIILQTGRTGRVTPVAVFKPVFLAGTKVERATLHNPENIQALGVDINASVIVRKAAEIIPEIVAVQHSTGSFYNIFAHKCPSCGGEIVPGADENGDNESGAYCANPDCPAQLANRFIFWASRDCMNIDGFGPALVDKFIEKGWLKSYPDIYRLKDHKDEMTEIDGFGAKAAAKLLAAIEKSKENDIDRLIKALSIPGVGRHIGKNLAKKYPDMDAIGRLTIYELSSVDGIGDISAQTIYEWFNDVANTNHEDILIELENLGVNMKSKSYNVQTSDNGTFSGKTFVITGTLPNMKREEASALIEANGGKVSGSVSKQTDYLLAGEKAGSKLDKAKSLGVKIISEEELKKMLI